MPNLHLYIANKNYSSWSLRPWIWMKVKGIEFQETLAPFDEPNHNQHFLEFSPSKKVPVLHIDQTIIWESLAICETLADLHPDLGLWPADPLDRAKARAISAEMASGFSSLRAECPMNMRRDHYAISVSDSVFKDVARVEEIWSECLEASGGPFLFGDFSIADAMYAPVVNRLQIYCLSDSPVVTQYRNAIQSLDAWQEWEAAGRAEPWIVEEDEA